MTIEIGLTPDSRWDVGIAGLVAAARDAGFTGLGVSARQADATCAAALVAGGLRCHELLSLVVTRDEESCCIFHCILAFISNAGFSFQYGTVTLNVTEALPNASDRRGDHGRR